MDYIISTFDNLIHQSAVFNMTVGNLIMIAVAFVFLYLAIKKGFEPLLLVPIAFGMLLVNIFPDILICIDTTVGMLTPPVGMAVYTVSTGTGVPVGKVFKVGVVYALIAGLGTGILIILFPQITTLLPNLLLG